ncbi:MAG: transposase [Deltaproteobacteria bacterium]|nr:transposase [Deltaproteobacteria bacterium]
MLRFYTQQHKYYCGIDLHARSLHLCILDQAGTILSQYNLPAFGKKLAAKANREGVEEHCPDPSVRKSMEVDLALSDHYGQLLGELELSITRTAKPHDVNAFYRLRSVPGIGKVLALGILYEVQDLARFPRV